MPDYIPERGDIVWLDFEPAKGKAIGKYRPALVSSSLVYNQQTGLLICCPVSTSIRGAATEVPVGNLAAPAGVRYSLTNPQAYIDSNIVGFINILEACRHVGVQNLSYASSSSAPYKIYNIGNNNPVELLPLQAEDVPATFANVDDLVEDLG